MTNNKQSLKPTRTDWVLIAVAALLAGAIVVLWLL